MREDSRDGWKEGEVGTGKESDSSGGEIDVLIKSKREDVSASFFPPRLFITAGIYLVVDARMRSRPQMKIYEARIGRGMEAEPGEDEATELSRFPDEL